MIQTGNTSKITTLIVTNSDTAMLLVRIEPWAEEHQLKPGQRLELSFTSPEDVLIELEPGPQTLTVYGWRGSTFSAQFIQ